MGCHFLLQRICLTQGLKQHLRHCRWILYHLATWEAPYMYMLCLVTQSCPTLCDPLDCSLPGSSVHGDSSGKNTGVGCHTLLQGVFPTQALSPGLLHCRQILYCLSHKGSPYMYIHMHKETYYKNLNCMIMETDKSGEPQLAGWRPRRTDAIVPAWVQRPEN